MIHDALLDRFQEATGLAVELEMCPRWRWRRRQRLEVRYAQACEQADFARVLLGGDADATPTREIIANTQAMSRRNA